MNVLGVAVRAVTPNRVLTGKIVSMMVLMKYWWLLVASWAVVTAQPTDRGLEAALKAHQAGEYEQAAAGYRTFLKANPGAFEIRSNLGAVLVRLAKYAEAIDAYKLALRKAPANAGIGFNLALAYYKSGAIPEAARELSTVRAITPDPLPVNLLLGDCWLQMGEFAKVSDLLAPLELARPDDLGLAYLLGTALVRQGKAEEGQKQLNKIFARGDSGEVRLLLGTAKLNAADVPGAMEELKKAVELSPDLPSAHAYLGQALLMSGDSDGAAKAFQRELAISPYDFNANLSMASLLRQDQDYEKAKMHLERALRVRPGDTGVRYQQGSIALAENKVDQARQMLEAVVADAPEFVEAHVSLATVYYRLKRKADGDRERALVEKLNVEIQARQPKGDPIPAKGVPQP